jgi:membrane-associated protease RseP (regulator of RpoE activity)
MDREGKQLEQVERELGSLPKVEAPVNFEQMVRTQIAEGRPAESTGRAQFMLALKFALPTLVLMVFGAILIFSGMKAPSDQAVAPVDERQLRPDSPLSADTEAMTAGANNATRNLNVNTKANSLEIRAQMPGEDQGGGSVNLAVKPESPVYPDGLDPNARRPEPRNVPPGRVQPSAILSMLGLKINCESAGCSIAQLVEGSPGAKAGLKVGDVIEKINDTPLSSDSFVGSVDIQTITVRRGGRQVRVQL